MPKTYINRHKILQRLQQQTMGIRTNLLKIITKRKGKKITLTPYSDSGGKTTGHKTSQNMWSD